jgi:phosphoribosylamine--glycine ligase
MDEALLPLMERVARGERIEDGHARSRAGAAVTTVVASGGYPGPYEKGKTIRIPADLETEHTMVFHAGTRLDGDQLVTSGGRVLAVTALAPTFAEAADRSRDDARRIEFEGAFHRGDIGWRERQRTEEA